MSRRHGFLAKCVFAGLADDRNDACIIDDRWCPVLVIDIDLSSEGGDEIRNDGLEQCRHASPQVEIE